MESVSGTLAASVVGFIFSFLQQWLQGRQTTGTNGSVVAEGETCITDDNPFEPTDVPYRHRFLELLRGSVRPVITHGFFWAYIGVKATLLVWALSQEPATKLLPVFWAESDEVLLATTLSYWFGSRLFVRYRR